MAELKDHRAAIAASVKELSETAGKPADLSAKLAASDLEPARIPADASAAIAAAGPRLATPLAA
jgi:hypothetical protein